MICPNCQREVPDTARACGHCGHWLATGQRPSISSTQPQRKSSWLWIGLGVLALIVVGGFAYLLGRSGNTPPEATVAAIPTAASQQPANNPQPNIATPASRSVTIPTPTKTPQPTPAPTATTNADLTIYDDFNNPVSDERFDEKLWLPDFWGACKVAQQKGIMIFKSGSASDGSGCRLLTIPHPVAVEALEEFEAKIKIADDYTGKEYVVQGIQYGTDKYPGGYWAAFCGLTSDASKTPSATFDVWSDRDGNETGQSRPAKFDQWYDFRLELDSETMTIKCFVDNKLIGSTIPKEAALLKKLKLDRYLDMFRGPDTFVTGYVDDVRILP